jgi:cytochrome c biogenesis protein CcmG/thiol:disulfide interchange protein DsbE
MRWRWFMPAFFYLAVIVLAVRAFIAPRDTLNRQTEISLPLPGFSLPTLDGKGTFTDKDLRGNVYVVHFFASWCPACEAEQPHMVMLADKYHIPLYAIAWHDTPEAMRPWLKGTGRVYRAIGMDDTGKATIAFGVQGLPETYLVDKDGVLRYRYRGYMSISEIEEHLLPLYRRLTHAP